MGEGNVTTAGAADLQHVNSIAREMIYRCGFSKRLGPVSLMDNEEVYINKEQSRAVANIGSELAAIATTEVEEVCSLLVQQHFEGIDLFVHRLLPGSGTNSEWRHICKIVWVFWAHVWTCLLVNGHFLCDQRHCC